METRANKRLREYLVDDNVEDIEDSEPQPKKEKVLPRILDGKYFIVLKQDGTKIEAECATCGTKRKGDTRSTGNFMEHYNSKHPTMADEVNKYKKLKNSNDSLKQTTLPFVSAPLTTHVVSII